VCGDHFFPPEIIAAHEPFPLAVRPKDVRLATELSIQRRRSMRKFNLKTFTMALVVAAVAVPVAAVTPAAAKFPGPGGWGKGGWGWGPHPHWGWHHGFGRGGYAGYYGGGDCYLKRYVDEYGELVIRKVCY
jgi:hypothetical protein